MSAVWVKISTFLCLCYTAEMSGVVWREVGQSITIQCGNTAEPKYLNLKVGINEEKTIYTSENSGKETFNQEFQERVQTHGKFPKKDILIKNLQKNDTGAYWCVYTKVDVGYKLHDSKGQGSLLLVVTEASRGTAPSTKPEAKCEEPSMTVVVYIAIAVAVWLIAMLGFMLWVMRKTKTSYDTVNARGFASNDVYEDMRGTIRR